MTYTKPVEPILFIEGGPIHTLKANGIIYAGQCLTAYGTMECDQAGNNDDAFVGVAMYDVADNIDVAIAGPGNIVRVIPACATISKGDDIMCSGSEGKVANETLAAGTKIGVALEDAVVDVATRVLLV